MPELKSYDLFITDIKNSDGETCEVVRINSRLAFNKDFIDEMKAAGVKKYVYETTETEEV